MAGTSRLKQRLKAEEEAEGRVARAVLPLSITPKVEMARGAMAKAARATRAREAKGRVVAKEAKAKGGQGGAEATSIIGAR
jgi:hypothetical protein